MFKPLRPSVTSFVFGLLALGATACQFEPPLAQPIDNPREEDRGASPTTLDGTPAKGNEPGADAAALLEDAGLAGEAGVPTSTQGKDAGAMDAASRVPDASAILDAGVPIRDAGVPMPDAGVPMPDAGVSPVPGGFDYTPSNFDPSALPANGASIEVSGGDCTITFDTLGTSGACMVVGRSPILHVMQPSGIPVDIVTLSTLRVAPDARLLIEGSRPVILVVRGDAEISGVLSVSASLARSGPGGGLPEVCGDGGAGGPVDQAANGTSGGGGGGFATPGGVGGEGVRPNALGGSAGGQNGNAILVPIRGGCLGGAGGTNVEAGRGHAGGAGGAIQISASGTLRIDGEIWAVGAGGGGGPRGAGGGGGGSGGGVLLEARSLVLGARARILANGGSGGEGGGGTPAGNDGADGSYGSTLDAVPAPGGANITPSGGDGGNGGAGAILPTDGLPGSAMSGGGGGGGGAAGRIRINTAETCTIAEGAIFSPAPTSNDSGRCNR